MRRFWSLSLAGLICLASSAAALGAGWDLVGQYSIASNPTGAWSYGRKWSATAPGLDVFGVRWGSYGWYMGNVGHGGPSIQGVAGSSVILWAKNNSNGLACARWTAPFAGRFTLHAAFVGADSRGVDNNVYVVVDGVQLFTARIVDNTTIVPFDAQELQLGAGSTIDLVVQWAGGVYSEYGWISASAHVSRGCGCPADVDDGAGAGACDGGTDINDLLFFLAAYSADDARADLDDGTGNGTPDGGIDINDLLYFLAHYEAGC